MASLIKHFKANVLLKDIIGRQLINNDNLAILELVKNSIDAKASDIDVIFSSIHNKRGESKMVLIDNGTGMDLNDLENKWLNIAYSEKRNSNEHFAGEKGVGRFSCDRLGKYLNLYTKKKNDEIFHLQIDWTDFEKENSPNLQIQDIDVAITKLTGEELAHFGFHIEQCGTILEISQLRSEWDLDKLYKLKNNYISKLINNRQTKSLGDFRFNFESIEYPKLNGEVKSKIFDSLSFKTTYIETCTIENSDNIETTLKSKGQIILKIIEKNPFIKYIKDIKISIFFLNPYAKAYFLKEVGERSVHFGSMFLFRNGFRVLPYGDYGNDWLGLDLRRGQGIKRYLSTRDVVGKIELNDVNYFIPVSSREGLVENDAYKMLTSRNGIFYLSIKRLEKFVVEGLKWDSAINKEYPLEFEKRIIENKGKNIDNLFKEFEKEEHYNETQEEKNKRALDAIYSILRLGNTEILSVEINPDLINDVLEEDQIKASKLIKELDKYKDKLVEGTNSTVEDIRLRLKLKEEEEKRKQAEQKAKEEEEKRKQAEQKAKEEEEKRKQAEQKAKEEEEKRKQAEQKAKEEEEAKNRAEEQVKQLVGDNLFMKDAIQDDVKLLLKSIRHHINHASDRITKYVNKLATSINKSDSPSILRDHLEVINLENQKILTFSRYVEKVRYNSLASKINQDIVDFIHQYIFNVYKEYTHDTSGAKQLKINLNTQNSISLKTTFEPVEMTMVIDNLISNAFKARALSIDLSWEKVSETSIKLHFKDDGIGIPDDNISKIFDFGFSTTRDSGGLGLGLYHVKKIVDDMKSQIEVNNKINKGVEFILTFSKR